MSQQQQLLPPQPAQQPKTTQRIPDIKTQLKLLYDKPTIQFDESTIQLCPQINVLNSIVKYENRIDQLIRNKRVDLQESFVQPNSYLKRTLRIITYSEFVNEEWHIFVKGQLLPNMQKLNEEKKPFSHYLRQLEVQFDKTYYPTQNTINWVRLPQSQETNSFQFKRKGPQCDVSVTLHFQSYPQKYRLAKPLQQLLGLKEGTRSQVLYCFWEYIKLNNLMDKENKDYLIADESLKQLFGQERIPLSQLNLQLKFFLENPEPLVIKHHLINSNIQGYDVVVDYELVYQPELMPFLAQKVVTDESSDKKNPRSEHPFIQLNQKIKNLEKQIQKYVEQTKNHKIKRDSYLSYRKNPSFFLENLFLQQNAYLEMMQNEDELKNEDPKNLKFLVKNQELVERQIRRYLEQQQQSQQQQQQPQVQSQQSQQQQQQQQQIQQ